jgi:hypothetical protein
MHDKTYLHRTVGLFAAVIDQVHAALSRGVVTLTDMRAAVNVDRIGLEYTPGAPLDPGFHDWVGTFAKKAMQEALDRAADVEN